MRKGEFCSGEMGITASGRQETAAAEQDKRRWSPKTEIGERVGRAIRDPLVDVGEEDARGR